MNNISKQSAGKKKPNKKPIFILLGFYILFIVVSVFIDFEPGEVIGENFGFFAIDMFKLFPPAFILVGLFMVWVERKTVEKFFGEASGAMGFIAAILLACTTLYPFVVVLPMAAALSKKGARLGIVLTYLGSTAICRIPMTIFEASYLGIKFSIVRYVVSLPLIVISSIIIEKMLGKEYFIENNLSEGLEV